jgi:hypothetical protein
MDTGLVGGAKDLRIVADTAEHVAIVVECRIAEEIRPCTGEEELVLVLERVGKI